MSMKKQPTQIAVLGLGRFGQSLVKNLSGYEGVDILACDKREERLQAVAGHARHLVQADVADERALKEMGLGNFDIVVMAMSEDIRPAILATITARQLGARYIVAKAFGHREKEIFERVGADLVVVPEQEIGKKIARKLMHPNIIDVLEDAADYRILEMHPLEEWVGRSVREADIRNTHGFSLLAIIREGRTIMPVKPTEVMLATDNLVTISERKAAVSK